MDGVVCIDIGAVNVSVKFRWRGQEEFLDFCNGDTRLPSVVGVGSVMKFGRAAILSMSSGGVVVNLKQLIGKSFEDVVTRYRGMYLQKFGVPLENHEGQLSIPVKEGNELVYYRPFDVLCSLFRYIFNSLTVRYKMNITKTIVTVPTRFNDCQRGEYMMAVQDTAKEFGFEDMDVSLLDESVAATLGFMKTQNIFSPRTVLVFDFGGGSCDISILQVTPITFDHYSDGNITVKEYIVSVLATSELPKGGDDVDRELMNDLLVSFRNENPRVQYLSTEDNKQDYYNLLLSVSQMKEWGGGEVALDYVIENIDAMDQFSIELKPDAINSVVKKYMDELITLIRATIARAFASIPSNSRRSQIDMVLPVGGMCNLNCVTECLINEFGKAVVCPPQLSSVLVDGGLMNAPNPCCILKNFESITRTECYFLNEPKDESNSAGGGTNSAGLKDVIIPRGTRLPFVKMKFFKPKQPNQEWIDTKFYVKGNEQTKVIPVRFRNQKDGPFMITVEVNSSFDATIYVSFLSTREKKYVQTFILN